MGRYGLDEVVVGKGAGTGWLNACIYEASLDRGLCLLRGASCNVFGIDRAAEYFMRAIFWRTRLELDA